MERQKNSRNPGSNSSSERNSNSQNEMNNLKGNRQQTSHRESDLETRKSGSQSNESKPGLNDRKSSK